MSAVPVRLGLGTPGLHGAGAPERVVVESTTRWELALHDLGLACCAVEVVSALLSPERLAAAGGALEGGPEQARVLVVSGTLTDVTAPAAVALYDQLEEPRYVISFGACATSGGPYWDSYSVTKGVDQLLPVDVYVAGCPPRPEALLEGLVRLAQQVAA